MHIVLYITCMWFQVHNHLFAFITSYKVYVFSQYFSILISILYSLSCTANFRSDYRVLSNAFNKNIPKLTCNLHYSLQSSGKKAPTRYDKHVRAFAEKKKFSKAQRAVTISIEGRNMALWFNLTFDFSFLWNIQQDSRHFPFSCEENWELQKGYNCKSLPICEIVKLWVAMGIDLVYPADNNQGLEPMVIGVFLTVLFIHRNQIPSIIQTSNIVCKRLLPGAYGIGSHGKLLWFCAVCLHQISFYFFYIYWYAVGNLHN